MAVSSTPFYGMRGTGDWVTNQRPENWRQTLLRLYPNGSAPLTAILSMCKNEKTDDPHYHWWTKALANQRASVTGVFTDVALTVAYVGGTGVSGDTVYIRMSAADVDKLRAGHQAIMRVSVEMATDVIVRITGRAKNGASSYVIATLMENDDNGVTYTMASADVLWIIGNINPEGSTLPDAIMYDPVEYENYCQIFRTPLSHTRTAMRTRLRTGDQVKEARREALELHGIEMEKAFIFSKRTLGTGDNGKPMRTTQGIIPTISTHRYDFVSSGGTWITDGETWLDNRLSDIFLYGPNTRLCLCGNGFLNGIAQLAKARGTFELTSMVTAYGIHIYEYVTPTGVLHLKTHPLFNQEPTMRNVGLVIAPENLVYRFIDDTFYTAKRHANDLDGESSDYLTEAGLELHHEETFALLEGIGLNTHGTLTTTPPTTTAPTTTATTAAPTTLATTPAPTTEAPTTTT